jgi:5-methylcytosine-specific restriction protein A
VSEAKRVDHILALVNGGADDESNLQSLCIPCHDVKTREDLGQSEQFARDDDGWLVPRLPAKQTGRAGKK